MKISIVIPVFNSQDSLAELHVRICEGLRGMNPWELILVNDKSEDKSWELIESICSKDPNVKALSLRKNFGQDNAILAGLSIASGDYVCIMDDDLQHDPADIPKLYAKCLEGYDVCYGRFNAKKQKRWKNFGSWINGKLAERLLEKPPGLYLSPFKIITRAVVQEVLRFRSSFPYVDATLLTITKNMTEVEITHHERKFGAGNYNFIRSLFVFINHLTNYSIYPLRLVTMTGFISAIISFLGGGFYLVQYLYSDKRVEGWISIILLLIFFGGLILMSIGLIGEYIGRIFLSVNNKALYSIDKTFNVYGKDENNKSIR
ncbi:MAG: glycosyltransferase family 2 protein [Bacteroidia bacterium]